jgi:hypothetical protein
VKIVQRLGRILTAFALVVLLTTTTACSSVQAKQPTSQLPGTSYNSNYSQLELGNTEQGQDFGNWVVATAKGVVSDAYVRDNNKLGVVISPQVRPTEVRPLAKSLVQGFHKNFPGQDLTVLVYAPDKKLILTAKYDTQSNQIAYNS